MKKIYKYNPLNIRSKKETVFAVALLHSGKFRESRKATKKGRELYNKEIDMVKRKIKQFKINLRKPLPNKMKV